MHISNPIFEKPLQNDRFVINKSRYDSIDSYLSNDTTYKAKYDDIDLVYDHNIYNKLRSRDVDDKLAKHVAHLFIRDPLVIFKELLDLDDTQSSDHFEVNFHSGHTIGRGQLYLTFLIELTINKLANYAFQAPTT